MMSTSNWSIYLQYHPSGFLGNGAGNSQFYFFAAAASDFDAHVVFQLIKQPDNRSIIIEEYNLISYP
jgi:hypothetical protein